MIEVVGDLWTYKPQGKPLSTIVRCITTNGFVKNSGEAVMGRGCAAEAKDRIPGLALSLGSWIRVHGNIVMGPVTSRLTTILTFPVKHRWMEDADLELIAKSSEALRSIALKSPGLSFILPKPGCGNGRLKYEQVKPILIRLPDNVYVIDRV